MDENLKGRRKTVVKIGPPNALNLGFCVVNVRKICSWLPAAHAYALLPAAAAAAVCVAGSSVEALYCSSHSRLPAFHYWQETL